MIGRFRLAICPSRDSTSSSCYGPAPLGPTNTAADLTDLSFFCSSFCHRVPGGISQASSQGQDATFLESLADGHDLLLVLGVVSRSASAFWSRR